MRCLSIQGSLTGLVLAFVLALPAAATDQRVTPIVKAVQKARPAVVNIHSEKTLSAPDTRYGHLETTRRVNGMGTGVVVDERGFLVTNHHVIDGVEKIRVTLDDGTTHPGRLVAYDRECDLALLKIDAGRGLTTITLGTSQDLMTGEPVIAVGNAFGYEHTVTRGIISALNRSVQLSETQQYKNLIQTDASINPGNSGGPLLNIDGEMIGINVAVRAGAQGIGFAIPVDDALEVVTRLLRASRSEPLWHGIVALPVAAPLDAVPGETPQAKLIATDPEPESPAAKAGLQSGDSLLKIEGTSIARLLDLERAFLARKHGDQVSVEVERAGKAQTLTLKLASPASTVPASQSLAWSMLGLKVEQIPVQEFAQRRTRYRGGLEVKSVRPEGPAAKQGIRPGDVLVGLHIWETVSLENVAHILSRPELEQLTPVKFYVVREGRTLYGHVPLDFGR